MRCLPAMADIVFGDQGPGQVVAFGFSWANSSERRWSSLVRRRFCRSFSKLLRSASGKPDSLTLGDAGLVSIPWPYWCETSVQYTLIGVEYLALLAGTQVKDQWFPVFFRCESFCCSLIPEYRSVRMVMCVFRWITVLGWFLLFKACSWLHLGLPLPVMGDRQRASMSLPL